MPTLQASVGERYSEPQADQPQRSQAAFPLFGFLELDKGCGAKEVRDSVVFDLPSIQLRGD